ncbi:unnamed protein product [Rotaria sordida]|uniref:Uncharacterized protein n=1 Tax=Rotaria sordida TaxID=392033 RepID=A0A813W695_9BILA|nr:unnamed protein product [Rotaria sordida]CAF0925492.1 unnamed protein product [Rotaria sordida]CAF0944015.1 unnamed protein product [Rotaria sordida]CAF1037359.1 unnamed protein product [Rotaria sordida]CAF1039372.1 unnamed protein product [Rotaria sordida]
MSKFEIKRKNYFRSKSTRKIDSPDSNNDELEETIDDKNSSMMIDNNILIMKTPQSLDDLLDVDDNNNENDEDKEENENDNNNNNNDDVDNDSTHLSIDDPTTTEQTRQKKSIEKNGKI